MGGQPGRQAEPKANSWEWGARERWGDSGWSGARTLAGVGAGGGKAELKGPGQGGWERREAREGENLGGQGAGRK